VWVADLTEYITTMRDKIASVIVLFPFIISSLNEPKEGGGKPPNAPPPCWICPCWKTEYAETKIQIICGMSLPPPKPSDIPSPKKSDTFSLGPY